MQKLSDEKRSNDDIIDMLQKNQRAEEKGMTAGLVIALGGFILSAVFTSWIIAVVTLFISIVIGCGVYKFNQPNTKCLKLMQVKRLIRKLPCKTKSSPNYIGL